MDPVGRLRRQVSGRRWGTLQGRGMSRWEQPDLRHMVTTWLVNGGGPRAHLFALDRSSESP